MLVLNDGDAAERSSARVSYSWLKPGPLSPCAMTIMVSMNTTQR